MWLRRNRPHVGLQHPYLIQTFCNTLKLGGEWAPTSLFFGSRSAATELLFCCGHNFARLEAKFLLQFFERRRGAERMHSDHSTA